MICSLFWIALLRMVQFDRRDEPEAIFLERLKKICKEDFLHTEYHY